MAALVLIYGLIVWEFRNFALAGLIMSPIPLTLLGIIPGHLIMGAEFTATSMIGLIALGGIIVRQSILIVEFVKIEAAKGKSVTEAAVLGAEVRMRPILITSLTTAGGAWTLINDPIFQGMAVSIFFGAMVGTLMAVIVIPLGCISARRQFYMVETVDGDIALSERYAAIETEDPCEGLRPLRGEVLPVADRVPPRPRRRTKGKSLPLRLWGWLVTAALGVAGLVRWLLRFGSAILGLLRSRRSSGTVKGTPPRGPGGAGGPGGGGLAPAAAGSGGAPPTAPAPTLAAGMAGPNPAEAGACQAQEVKPADAGPEPRKAPAPKKPRAPRRPKLLAEADAPVTPPIRKAPRASGRARQAPGGPGLEPPVFDGASPGVGAPGGVPAVRREGDLARPVVGSRRRRRSP
jgi:hypothetical protein